MSHGVFGGLFSSKTRNLQYVPIADPEDLPLASAADVDRGLVRAALPGSGISAVSAPGFLFPSASPRLPPCLRGSASKSLPRFPIPFHHGSVLCLELVFPFGPLFAKSGRATLP